MADLTTYTGLKAAIADYLGRDDLTDRIPTFIRLAEKRMERDLRVRVLEKRAVRVVEAGCKGVKLPANRTDGNWNVFVEMRDIAWEGDDGHIADLQYMPPDGYKCLSMGDGRPTTYTIIGDDLFFMPTPECSGKIDMAYYSEIPPLSETQVCNPLLHVAPDLYLYATLLESVPFTRGSVPAQEWMTAYSEAVTKLNNQERRARFTSNLKMRHDRRI